MSLSGFVVWAHTLLHLDRSGDVTGLPCARGMCTKWIEQRKTGSRWRSRKLGWLKYAIYTLSQAHVWMLLSATLLSDGLARSPEHIQSCGYTVMNTFAPASQQYIMCTTCPFTNRLDTLHACARVADCLPYLLTWSLPSIIIEKKDFPLPRWESEKAQGGGEREGEGRESEGKVMAREGTAPDL